MAEAFSLIKEKFSLDLPKSRKQQTHKTFSDSGRAAEDAPRDSAGHTPTVLSPHCGSLWDISSCCLPSQCFKSAAKFVFRFRVWVFGSNKSTISYHITSISLEDNVFC